MMEMFYILSAVIVHICYVFVKTHQTACLLCIHSYVLYIHKKYKLRYAFGCLLQMMAVGVPMRRVNSNCSFSVSLPHTQWRRLKIIR